MKNLYTIILVLIFPLLSFGQSDYCVIDSTLNGINLIDGGALINSRLCQVKKGKEIIAYSPYEVMEYGFKEGRVYISKEIQIADSSKRVFLERLHNDETTLYYYRGMGLKTFFIEKDSTLFVELPKQDNAKEPYSELLLNLTDDCPNVSAACKLVRYNKRSLSKIITRYNKCELKPFPHFKYGFLVGYEFSNLVPVDKQNKDLEYFEYNYDSDFSIGLFVDNPILVSDFSVYAALLFSKHGYSYNHPSATGDFDLIMNISTLSVPLLIRYTLPTNNLRPYLNTGPIYSYNIKNESYLYKSTISDNIIEIKNSIEGSIIPTHEFGYTMGCGLEVDLDFKRAVFLEIRYSKQFGISENLSGNNSMINISTGINF